MSNSHSDPEETNFLLKEAFKTITALQYILNYLWATRAMKIASQSDQDVDTVVLEQIKLITATLPEGMSPTFMVEIRAMIKVFGLNVL